MNMEDVSKLPKWAQSRIYVLECKIAHMQELHAKVLNGQEKSDGPCIIIGPYDDRHVHVSHKTYIEFNLGKGHESRIRVSMKDGYLDVNAGGTVNITPNASNSFYVSVPPRFQNDGNAPGRPANTP